jgi:uncharacterized protein
VQHDLEGLWAKVIAEATADTQSIHGTEHWARVERNGIYLARVAGVDDLIVRLFALLHDCQRLNDGSDPEHGNRAASYARTIRDDLQMLEPKAFDQLCYACEFHTLKTHTDDQVVGICWDADRLDLGRVSIQPSARYLNSEAAKVIATNRSFDVLDNISLRVTPS